MKKIKWLFFASLFFLVFSAGASDLDKEKRWAGQVVEAILDGDAIWLNDGSNGHRLCENYLQKTKVVNVLLISI